MPENVYFAARKEATVYNERLKSREGAAELLGIHPSTLADYELGLVKFVPPDKVVLMADLYNRPDLKNLYCKNECPIGYDLPLSTEIRTIEGVAIRLLRQFDPDIINKLQRAVLDIAADGRVSPDEIPRLKEVVKTLDQISVAIDGLRLASQQIINEDGK